MDRAERAERRRERLPKRNSVKEYSVLYVDDEASNLRIFRLAFKRYYNIHIAESGMEAIELLKNEKIDLIVTDQKMPEMTGTELLEKTMDDYPSMVRIILTGFADIQAIAHAVNKCGIYKYITKPYDQGELKITLDKALESNKLKQERQNLLEQLERHNQELELKVQERTQKLEDANKRLTEGLEYARMVQEHLLPSAGLIATSFNECFVIFKPLDHVSGDFYWYTDVERDGKQYGILAVMDCMGHGVAGALLSIMGDAHLSQIVKDGAEITPDGIFNKLDEAITTVLKKEHADAHETMDGSVIVYDKAAGVIHFAGAKSNLVYFKDNERHTIKGTRKSIGSSWNENLLYEAHEVPTEGITEVYLFTDGYPDQVGGESFKKFKAAKLLELLEEIHSQTFDEQQQLLESHLKTWMGDADQIDDITLMGIRI